MNQRNVATIVVSLLGAAKLVLESFGISVIDNSQIDEIANGVSALVTVAGVVMTHIKPKSTDTNQTS